MSDQMFSVRLHDVYDLAYDIARDFEKVALRYDIEELKPVINKVISVLELLESSIQRIDLLEAEISNIKSHNLRLYSEKIISDQEKSKLKQVYEESEESWLGEVVTLKSLLSSLKTENELLKSHLAEKRDDNFKSDDKVNEVSRDQSDIILRLNRKIKEAEKQIQVNASTINALNSRIQELVRINEVLYIKNEAARKDISKLIVEKNDAKNELKLYKKENMLLSETVQELLQCSSNKQERNERSVSGKLQKYESEENLSKDFNCQQNPVSVTKGKIRKLQSELQSLRSDLIRYELSELNVPKVRPNEFNVPKKRRNVPLSRIHQLFHLFLGVTSPSEFSWF